MNRRSFLSLALASCTAGLVGCGRRAPEATPTSAPTALPPTSTPIAEAPAVVSAGTPLSAPPLASKHNPVREGVKRIPYRLEIPTIDVDIPVVELGWSQKEQAGQIFSEWDVAAYAAGWHKNSALPGEGGNVVMSGHNNILGAVFRELDQLKKDDQITVWASGNRYLYGVNQVIVLPDKGISDEQRAANARWIGPFDEERLTLVSCWPRNNNTHRIVVVARPLATA
jgi:sortase A